MLCGVGKASPRVRGPLWIHVCPRGSFVAPMCGCGVWEGAAAVAATIRGLAAETVPSCPQPQAPLVRVSQLPLEPTWGAHEAGSESATRPPGHVGIPGLEIGQAERGSPRGGGADSAAGRGLYDGAEQEGVWKASDALGHLGLLCP